MKRNMLPGGNAGFTCQKCGLEVLPAEGGNKRNHCPECFFSLHVDASTPGDRESHCNGLMEPIAIEQKNKEWRVLHKCTRCEKEIWNKLLLNSKIQPDNIETMNELMRKQAYSPR